jgi:hypothetical protein
VDSITSFPYTSQVYVARGQESYEKAGTGYTVTSTPGYAILSIHSKNGTGTGASYNYSYIFVDQRPSMWQAAKTADGKILNDQYLVNA